ncbi:Obg-like ATPase 1 [Liparis tanakae]|uniref:Obg-like ATPase 1 n=1 Tax=Liparis tanakae TaxID=230148 RepID=A0A4Z2H1K4_9TELE|nr:Obg-like ATPase 1 [Liparis tanakae]
MEIIPDELRLKDEEMIGPIIDKLEKTAIRGGDKKLKPEYILSRPSLACGLNPQDLMCKIKSWVMDEKKHVGYYHDWNDKERRLHAHLDAGVIAVWRSKDRWPSDVPEETLPQPSPLCRGGRLLLAAPLSPPAMHCPLHIPAPPCPTSSRQAAPLLLEYFSTAGPDEVRPWTIRAAGKYRKQGGNLVEDGDIIFFKFNSPN